MRQTWGWSFVALVILSAASYGVFRATRSPELPEGFLYGNGHIEGTEIRVASEVAGRVVEQALIEGGVVRQGQTLVVIEPRSSLDELRAVQGRLAALRETRVALDSQITVWTHHIETARRQVERARALRASNAVSDEEVELAEDALREAEGQLDNLRAQRDALGAQIETAEARVRLAQTQLEKTEVPAPVDGTVLVRAVEVGEVVQAGQPLALIVDLERLELKLYIPERDLGKVRLGDDARVRVDSFPDAYFEARVARVDDYAQFTPRDIHVPAERTRMVYGVTLALENPEQRLKPGMPADAWIRSDGSRSWLDQLPVPES